MLEHGRAHRVLAGTDRGGEAGGGDLLLLRRGDEVDRRSGDRTDLGGDVDQRLELAFGRVAQDVVAGQRLLASLGTVEDVWG
nr:hypothetical protein [Terrabacter sp. Soil810]